MDKYRLIWFQHLHKAAGTTIVELAKNNMENFYSNHKNGNPYDENDEMIEIWKFDKNDLKSFIDDCERKKITFVATEWGSPNFKILSEDSRVVLITAIRDPIDRLISNYYYDLFKGFTKEKDIISFLDTQLFNTSNYYTIIFSNKDYKEVKKIGLNNQDLKKAIKNFNLFNNVFIMKDNHFLEKVKMELSWSKNIPKPDPKTTKVSPMVKILSRILGWQDDPKIKKKTVRNPFLAYEILKKLKFILFFKYIKTENLTINEKEERILKEKNNYDIFLYDYIKSKFN